MPPTGEWNPSAILYALCVGGLGLLVLVVRAYVSDLIEALRENTKAVGEMRTAFAGFESRIDRVEEELEKRATRVEVGILKDLIAKRGNGKFCDEDHDT
jgi:hypothetical protein